LQEYQKNGTTIKFKESGSDRLIFKVFLCYFRNIWKVIISKVICHLIFFLKFPTQFFFPSHPNEAPLYIFLWSLGYIFPSYMASCCCCCVNKNWTVKKRCEWRLLFMFVYRWKPKAGHSAGHFTPSALKSPINSKDFPCIFLDLCCSSSGNWIFYSAIQLCNWVRDQNYGRRNYKLEEL